MRKLRSWPLGASVINWEMIQTFCGNRQHATHTDFVVISSFYLPLFGCRQTETTASQYSWSLLSQRDGFGDNWKKKRTTTDEEKETHGVFSVLTLLFQFNIYSRPSSNVSEHISVGSPAFWLTQSQISLCKIKASNYITYILRGHVKSKDTTRHCSLKRIIYSAYKNLTHTRPSKHRGIRDTFESGVSTIETTDIHCKMSLKPYISSFLSYVFSHTSIHTTISNIWPTDGDKEPYRNTELL